MLHFAVAIEESGAPRRGSAFDDDEAAILVGGQTANATEVLRIVFPKQSTAFAAVGLQQFSVGRVTLDLTAAPGVRHKNFSAVGVHRQMHGIAQAIDHG